MPPPKRPPRNRPAPKLGPHQATIDEWLKADQEAPRKQRHTARRVWQRLVEEHGAEISERQVNRYVAAKRREIGEVEAYVPLVSDAGVEAEVDWGQAQVIVRGEPVDVHLFLMRACHSGASFVAAFHSETQQAFLEGHVAAPQFFGGVFDLVRYDNLKAAVAKVLKGRRRTESDRFVALAPTTALTPPSASPASRGLTRRAVWRARSGGFAVATWCRCPRSNRSPS